MACASSFTTGLHWAYQPRESALNIPKISSLCPTMPGMVCPLYYGLPSQGGTGPGEPCWGSCTSLFHKWASQCQTYPWHARQGTLLPLFPGWHFLAWPCLGARLLKLCHLFNDWPKSPLLQLDSPGTAILFHMRGYRPLKWCHRICHLPLQCQTSPEESGQGRYDSLYHSWPPRGQTGPRVPG